MISTDTQHVDFNGGLPRQLFRCTSCQCIWPTLPIAMHKLLQLGLSDAAHGLQFMSFKRSSATWVCTVTALCHDMAMSLSSIHAFYGCWRTIISPRPSSNVVCHAAVEASGRQLKLCWPFATCVQRNHVIIQIAQQSSVSKSALKAAKRSLRWRHQSLLHVA